MKIAVTSQGADIGAQIDPRFGRARYFIIADTDTGEIQKVDNTPNLNAAQGAGIQTASKVIELGVESVITGHVGPKAFRTLWASGVSMYTGAQGTVSEALEQFKAGKLEAAANADVEGHWV